jgi:CRP/FNR family transcriptional regulator, cyclic AMP receptor protein
VGGNRAQGRVAVAGRGPSGTIDVSSGPSRSGIVEILAGVPLFSSLTKRQLRAVAANCSEAHFRPGEVMVKELDAGQYLLIVTAGTAKVLRGGKSIGTVGRGEVIGEMSLLDGGPRSATIVAEREVDALLLYGTAFRKLLADHPEMTLNLLLAQTARLRALGVRAAMYG